MKKVSELTTDEAMDFLCEVTPFVANITTDEELIKTLKEKLDKGDSHSRAEIMNFGATKVSKLAPILLKVHRDDVYGILAVAGGVTAEQVAEQNVLVTIEQITELCKDKELIAFFGSSSNTEGEE